jgi:yecA family protein
MPLLGHEGDPRWPGENVARHLCTALQARHDQLLQQLSIRPSPYQPVFAIMDDGAVMAADWAQGFLIGIDLRPHPWVPLGESEQGRRFLVPIVSQLPDWDERIKAGPGGKDLVRFRSKAQLFIPYCLGEIRRFWTRRGDGAKRPGSGARRAGSTVRGGLSGRRW